MSGASPLPPGGVVALSRRCLALVVAAVMAASIGFVAAEPARATPTAGCTSVKVLVVPDSWETRSDADPEMPAGGLGVVVDTLRKRFAERVSTFWLPYPAVAFEQGKTYFDSKSAGVAAAKAAIARIAKECPETTFMGIGQGQGADIVGDVAVEIGAGTGPIPASRFIAGGRVAREGASELNMGASDEANLGTRESEIKGVGGGRKAGYGALSGELVTVCLPGDGCATRQDDQLATAIGVWLSRLASADMGSDAARFATDLGTLGGEPARLSSIPLAAWGLVTQARDGNTVAAAKTASALSRLVTPVKSLIDAVGDPVVVNGLLDTRLGSRSHLAGQVLRVMSQVDFAGLAEDFDAASIAATKRDGHGLLSAAEAATEKLASLGGFPQEQIASAGRLLQCLRPVAVLARATDLEVVTGVDYGSVGRFAESVPGLARDGDIAGLHRALRGIEASLAPLATVVDKIDFAPVAELLAAWPADSSEWKVGNAVAALRRVDWAGITRDLAALGAKLDKFDSANQRVSSPGSAPTTFDDLFGVDVMSLGARVADLAKQGLVAAGTTSANPDRSLIAGLTPERVVARGIGVALRYSGLTSNTHDKNSKGGDKATLSALTTWLGERIASALIKPDTGNRR